VAINLQESSGWVAYKDTRDPDPELENYRFLVIRQNSGEVIYDSIVPLAANLKTHGFEMEPNDPRLQNLARNVDQNIIAPMEAYKRRLDAEGSMTGNVPEPMATPAPPPVAPESTANPTPAPSQVPTPGPVPPSGPEVVDGPPTSLSGLTVLSVDDQTIAFDMEPPTLLKAGDRLFLRHPPKIIQLPGMEDQIMTQGEVAGLARIIEVEDGAATARLLSGEVPDQVYFERDAETP